MYSDQNHYCLRLSIPFSHLWRASLLRNRRCTMTKKKFYVIYCRTILKNLRINLHFVILELLDSVKEHKCPLLGTGNDTVPKGHTPTSDRNRLFLHCGLPLNSFSAYCFQDINASSINPPPLLHSSAVASPSGAGRGCQCPHSERFRDAYFSNALESLIYNYSDNQYFIIPSQKLSTCQPIIWIKLFLKEYGTFINITASVTILLDTYFSHEDETSSAYS